MTNELMWYAMISNEEVKILIVTYDEELLTRSNGWWYCGDEFFGNYFLTEEEAIIATIEYLRTRALNTQNMITRLMGRMKMSKPSVTIGYEVFEHPFEFSESKIT